MMVTMTNLMSGPKSDCDTLLTTSIKCRINCKTPDNLYCLNVLFEHLLLQFECAHLFENIFIILSEDWCLSTRRLWIKQLSSLVNPTIATKLQFICIKTELAYIGRRRTTSFNENETWGNKNCKYYMHLTSEETQIPKGCHFFGPTCIYLFVYICCHFLFASPCCFFSLIEVLLVSLFPAVSIFQTFFSPGQRHSG